MTRVKFHHDGREIERTIDAPSAAAGTVAMLAGFLDCEELIAQWLERKADEEAGESDKESRHRTITELIRGVVLREAALAIRLGQYRREVEP